MLEDMIQATSHYPGTPSFTLEPNTSSSDLISFSNANSEVDLHCTSTKQMLADILTKQVPRDAFEKFRDALGVLGSPSGSDENRGTQLLTIRFVSIFTIFK
jgi:hypothetical protein